MKDLVPSTSPAKNMPVEQSVIHLLSVRGVKFTNQESTAPVAIITWRSNVRACLLRSRISP